LKCRSVNNIVKPPANTGRANNNKIAVNKTLHTNKGKERQDNPRVFIQKTVTIKLIAPNKLLRPETCKLKIAKSTLGLEWYSIKLKGG